MEGEAEVCQSLSKSYVEDARYVNFMVLSFPGPPPSSLLPPPSSLLSPSALLPQSLTPSGPPSLSQAEVSLPASLGVVPEPGGDATGAGDRSTQHATAR